MENYSIPSPVQTEICSVDFEHETRLAFINIQVYVCDYNIQKCWQFRTEDTVWDVKQTILTSLPKDLREGFNFGLFLPPCNGRAGKFLLEERPLKDYPFHDCVPYLEFKYKRRVYKMLNIDEKMVKLLQQKNLLKKFWDHVESRQVEKIEKLCVQGFDPNFHGPNGDTPLTLAAGFAENSRVLMALVSGGAHLDFRSLDGQTALHKAAVSPAGKENVKTLLALGASPSSRDSLNFTPLYRCTLSPKTCAQTVEILLRDYSEIGVTDVHGNQEIHQENCARILLFRGADPTILNCQGQTPYHVADLVGSASVAEVLKTYSNSDSVPYRNQPRYNSKRRFTWTKRGSDRMMTENYGSVRRLTSSASCYTPTVRAPSRGDPAVYCSFSGGRTAQEPPVAVQLAVNRHQTLPNEFRTVAVHSLKMALPNNSSPMNTHSLMMPANVKTDFYTCQDGICDDTNIPRILVIPRGKKGFGFILRGAKKIDSRSIFQPSLEIPALQYFEGVDTNGMAMRAGLKPGDFLLEINNVDVRCASHDQVVRLIQMASDTVTLKVVTVNLSNQSIFSHCKIPSRNGIKSPQSEFGMKISNNHPTMQNSGRQTVSYATGRSMISLNGAEQAYMSPLNERSPAAKSVDNLPSAFREPRAASALKVASVRQRSAHRRVSVAEIETLMQRQAGSEGAPSSTSSVFCGDALSSSSVDGAAIVPLSPGPRVYASVAEMKRQRRQGTPGTKSFLESPSAPVGNILTLRVSPQDRPRSPFYSGEPLDPNFTCNLRRSCSEFDTVKYRSMNDVQFDHSSYDGQNRDVTCSRISFYDQSSVNDSPNSAGVARHTPPKPPSRSPSCQSLAKTTAEPTSVKRPAIPPPPPPPPPPFAAGTQLTKPGAAAGASSRATDPNLLCSGLKNLSVAPNSDRKKDPAQKIDRPKSVLEPNFESDLKSAIAKRRICLDNVDSSANNGNEGAAMSSNQPSSDKCADRANAECLYTPIIRGCATSLKESVSNGILQKTSQQGGVIESRVLLPTSGLRHQPHSPTIYSSGQSKNSGTVVNNSGSLLKKDSGYTSSRSSLVEHPEIGEESGAQKPNAVFFGLGCEFKKGTPLRQASPSGSNGFEASGQYAQADMLRQNRVTVLSQKIEENINDLGGHMETSKKHVLKMPCNSREVDSMSLTSTASSSMLSATSHSPKTMENLDFSGGVNPTADFCPEVPPPDYDMADSGNGDSDQEQTNVNSESHNFSDKLLLRWTMRDVCDWLDSIRMGEYKKSFQKATVTGRTLLCCDRADFTKLVVTRVAHRIAMENSLKRFTSQDD